MDTLIEKLKDYVKDKNIPPIAEQKEIEYVEKLIGFKLPTLLFEIYTQVGNGGFGPGYGLLGICNGWTDANGNTVERLYYPGKRGNFKNLLPICYFGCLSYGFLECNAEETPVLLVEDYPKIEKQPLATSFREWLENWLAQSK